MKYAYARWFSALTAALVIFSITACSKRSDTTMQPAKPKEDIKHTYRTVGERSVIVFVSSDELEIREGGDNLVCKYTKQGNQLRVIISALGTTTAKYFDITPQGLVSEKGEVYYEPDTFKKITAQIQLNADLIAAVEKDDAAAIDTLVKKGAMVDTTANQGTPLMIAIKGGLTNAVISLLKNGADPNRKAIDGVTPLMLAASCNGEWGATRRTNNHDIIVNLLCKDRADINQTDKDGNTALILSLIYNNLEATRILVEAGADRSIANNKGLNALSYAKDDDEIADTLYPTAGNLDGVPVTAGEYRKAHRLTLLSQMLSLGHTPENDSNLRHLSWLHLASLRDAAQRGITSTEKELTDAIHSNFSDANGTFNPKRYQEFLQNVIGPAKYTEAEFEQYLLEQIIIQKLRSQISGQAKVSPDEVRTTYNVLMDSYEAEYVFIPDTTKAEAIYTAATSDLAAGKSFRQSASDMGVEVTSAVPFTGLSGSSSTDIVVQALAKAIAGRNQGEVAEPVSVNGGYIVAFLKVRTPADSSNFDAYQQEIASTILNRRAQSIFRDWQAGLLAPERFSDLTLLSAPLATDEMGSGASTTQ